MKTKRNVRMCWHVDGTNRIEWGEAVGSEGPRTNQQIIFKDGGWNWARDCFLTEQQCRDSLRLPPPKWPDQKARIAGFLESLAERVRDIEV